MKPAIQILRDLEETANMHTSNIARRTVKKVREALELLEDQKYVYCLRVNDHDRYYEHERLLSNDEWGNVVAKVVAELRWFSPTYLQLQSLMNAPVHIPSKTLTRLRGYLSKEQARHKYLTLMDVFKCADTTDGMFEKYGFKRWALPITRAVNLNGKTRPYGGRINVTLDNYAELSDSGVCMDNWFVDKITELLKKDKKCRSGGRKTGKIKSTSKPPSAKRGSTRKP